MKSKIKYHFECVSKSAVNMYFGARHTTVGNITYSTLGIQQELCQMEMYWHYSIFIIFYLFPDVFCILNYFSASMSYTFYLEGFTLLTWSISCSGTNLEAQGKYFLFLQLTKEGSDEVMWETFISSRTFSLCHDSGG